MGSSVCEHSREIGEGQATLDVLILVASADHHLLETARGSIRFCIRAIARVEQRGIADLLRLCLRSVALFRRRKRRPTVMKKAVWDRCLKMNFVLILSMGDRYTGHRERHRNQQEREN